MRKLTIVVFLTLCISALPIWYLILPDFRNAIEVQQSKIGHTITDRNGRLLRLAPGERGQFGVWCPIDNFPECVKDAVVSAEDHRFPYHPGFDPIALVRALWTNVTKGRIVSGASTITQQVVRLIKPRPRTYSAKIVELLEAIKMEIQLSKKEILELYLNLSPMGGNVKGMRLAARMYFGKDIALVSSAEAALLAALPRSPCRFDPRHLKGREMALREKDVILKRMVENGKLTEQQLQVMLGPSIAFNFDSFPLEAPHLTDYLLSSEVFSQSSIRTTIDLDVQHRLEDILKSHRERLARMAITQAGVIVASVQTGHVLAMVGSLKYGMKNKGFNNATLAKRSAGSTLKPFLYAYALEKGHQAFSEIPDTFRTYPTPYGDYLPHNADRRLYGPVTLRTALGNSLNISAVKLLKSIGIHPFYELLKKVGLVDKNSQKADYYGLGLAIGNMEVSLLQLVQGYLVVANMGEYRPLSFIYSDSPVLERVISPDTAYVISDILSDPTARLLTFGNPDSLEFGFPLAIKTGTSSNYKDCWIIGYTPKHVVGVWAGNFNGAPNRGVAGSKVCGPILKEIVHYLYGNGPPGRFPRPPLVGQELICWLSGKPASTACPYTYPELTIGPTASFEKCSMIHRKYQFLYLGPHYARWIHEREKEQGLARFRLKPLYRVIDEMEQPVFTKDLIRKQVGSIMGTTRITIVTPHDYDRYVLSPHNPNRIRFRAIANPLVPHVTWLIDGQEIERTPPPYEFLWNPTRGRHRIHAITPYSQAAQVVIDVE